MYWDPTYSTRAREGRLGERNLTPAHAH